MSPITTHILDTTRGKPAEAVSITLYREQESAWVELVTGKTDADGRIRDWQTGAIPTGVYKLRFDTKPYFDRVGAETFYPFVEIVFSVQLGEYYHIPLLLNPFGYSTYRGS